jgi:PqqD family protein of HPr-rel-A system
VIRYHARSSLLTENSGEELVVVDVLSRQVHELNATAASLWKRLERAQSARELAIALCHDYTVDMETARNDVEKILDELVELRLVSKEEH